MRRTGVLASRRRLMLGMVLSRLWRVYVGAGSKMVDSLGLACSGAVARAYRSDGIMYQEEVSNKWKRKIGL